MAAISRDDAIAALLSKGFRARCSSKKNDHIRYYYYDREGRQTRFFIFFSRGSGYHTVPDNLQGRALCTSGLEKKSEIQGLFQCPVGREEYEELIRQYQGSI
ncbi:MAG: hypothetical protein HY320_04230 [Armatimonadetes bacterium]|nr:hypothetical protein [Armatimonadota bacterium]